MVGHIKIDRKILNWEWYSDYKMVHLFIHLLIKANYKENTWQGILIRRGELITGLHKLSGATGLSVSQTRTCLSKLQATGEIAIKVTNKYSVITICKYNTYQTLRDTNNNQNSNQFDNQVSNQVDNQVSNTIRRQEDKNNLYTPAKCDFNGLPEIKIGMVVQLFKFTKQTDISSEQVVGLWEVFKEQNLTGKKTYRDEDDVYSHFVNWSGTKKIEKNGTNKSVDGTTRFNAGALELLAKGKEKYAAIRRKQGD
jgi:hypothetical protein